MSSQQEQLYKQIDKLEEEFTLWKTESWEILTKKEQDLQS